MCSLVFLLQLPSYHLLSIGFHIQLSRCIACKVPNIVRNVLQGHYPGALIIGYMTDIKLEIAAGIAIPLLS